MTRAKRKPKNNEKEKNEQLVVDKQTSEEMAKIGVKIDFETDEQKEIKRLLSLGKVNDNKKD